MIDVIKGHWNELFKKQEVLSESRMAICRACPLYLETSFGVICNNKLYLNTHTNEVSVIAKHGFAKGCACRLEAKTRNPDSGCPVNKW